MHQAGIGGHKSQPITGHGLPYFQGNFRQRGSGIGALAVGVSRFALPLIRRYAVPAARKVARELFRQAVPEVMDVVTKQKTPKQAIRSTVAKTIKKQIGGGAAQNQRKRKSPTNSSRIKGQTRQSNSITSPSRAKRSRIDFFSKVRSK